MTTATLNEYEPKRLTEGTKIYRVPGPSKRGQKLRSMREQAPATLRELAELCGIDHSLITRYESGERPVSVDTYMQLLRGIEKIRKQKEQRERVDELAVDLSRIEDAARALNTRLTFSEEAGALEEVHAAKANGTFPASPSKGHLHHAAVVLPPFYSGIVSSVLKRRTEQQRQRAAHLAALESLRARGIDDPVIVEIMESLRREIAEKDALLQALEDSADD